MASPALTAAMRRRYNQPYNAFSPPFPTYQAMVNEANRRSASDVNAAIGGLVKPAALNARREAEVRDISALTTAATTGQQALYDRSMQAAGYAPGQMTAASAMTAPTANAAILGTGLGAPAADPNAGAGNAVAAAMARNTAGTLAGNVAATIAHGPAEQLASRRRMEDQLQARDADVAKIQAARSGITSEYLDKLRAEAFQGQTAQTNLDMARKQMTQDEAFRRAQLGEQSRQFNASQEQQARQFAEQMGFNYDQLSQEDRQFVQSQVADQNAADAKNANNNNWRGTGVSQSAYQTAINAMQDYVTSQMGRTREVTTDTPNLKYVYQIKTPGERKKGGKPASYRIQAFDYQLHNNIGPNAAANGKATGLPPGWTFLRTENAGSTSAGTLVPDLPDFQTLYNQAAAMLRQRGVSNNVASQMAWNWVSNNLPAHDFSSPAYSSGENMNSLITPPSARNPRPKPKPKPKPKKK